MSVVKSCKITWKYSFRDNLWETNYVGRKMAYLPFKVVVRKNNLGNNQVFVP